MPTSPRIDHIGFAVSDIERSKRFYSEALAPLGIGVVMEVTAAMTGAGAHVGYGHGGKPYFWIGDGKDALPAGLHVAFTAERREDVDAFHAAALAAGGRDNGAPGLRPVYHEAYYAAFVLDPDGHNVEAVCQLPE